jgi:hypothetical protein
MARLNLYRIIVIVLSLVVASSIMAQCALAQSVPSVPEFKLSYTNNVYDVSPKTTIDEWSGEPTNIPGYHVDYREVLIKVRNQPHTQLINGSTANLFYSIREKNHYSNEWSIGYTYIGATDSEVTPFTVNLNGPTNLVHAMPDFNAGNMIDFQVKASIGFYDGKNFSGEESTWSETQTLTIASSASPSPTVPELSWLALVPLCLIVLSVALVLRRRKSLSAL